MNINIEYNKVLLIAALGFTLIIVCHSTFGVIMKHHSIPNEGGILFPILRTIAEWDTSEIPDSNYWEMGTCIAIARLWTGYKVDEANDWLEQVTDRHGTDRYGRTSSEKFPKPYGSSYQHDWDWVSPYIVRAYFQFKDSGKLSSEAESNMRSVLAFRSGTPTVSYSENHNTMIVSTAYFANEITGRDNTANTNWLSNFLDDKLKYHFKELNSPSYMAPQYRVLWNLYDFAPSDTLRRKAKAVLDMLLAEQAVIHVAGIQAGPYYRYYSDKLFDQSHDKVYAINHVYFGTSFDFKWEHTKYLDFPRLFAWYSSYKVPKIILDIAKSKKTPFLIKSKRKITSTIPTHYYTTSHCVLATAQGDFPDSYQRGTDTGARGHVWDIVFDTSPRKLIFAGDKESTYAYDESDAVQKNNVLITSLDRPIQYVNVSPISDGSWTFVQEGKTYVAIKELSNSRRLIEVRDADEYGKSFRAFKSDIKDNHLSVSGDSVTYKNTYGETIKSPSKYSMEGDSFSYKLFDSPYLSSEWGSGVITVKYGLSEYKIQA